MLNKNSAFKTACDRTIRLEPLALILVSAVVIAALAFGAYTWLTPANAASIASTPQQSNANTNPKAEQNIRFTLYDVGILPRMARTPQGRVSISIVDRSGGSSGVVVERLDGTERIAAGQVERDAYQQRGRQEMELQPGTYLVTMADRPGNSATLIVEP